MACLRCCCVSQDEILLHAMVVKELDMVQVHEKATFSWPFSVQDLYAKWVLMLHRPETTVRALVSAPIQPQSHTCDAPRRVWAYASAARTSPPECTQGITNGIHGQGEARGRQRRQRRQSGESSCSCSCSTCPGGKCGCAAGGAQAEEWHGANQPAPEHCPLVTFTSHPQPPSAARLESQRMLTRNCSHTRVPCSQ